MLLAADANRNVLATGEDYDAANFCSAWPNSWIWAVSTRQTASGTVPVSATMVRASGGNNPPSATPVYLIRKTYTADASGLITIAYDWPDIPFCGVTPWILTANSRPPVYGIVSKTKSQTIIKLWRVVTQMPVLTQALDVLVGITAAGEKADVELSL